MKNIFGEYLKELREKRGYTVNKLALKSGVSAAHISRLENGVRPAPSPKIIDKFAMVLGNYEGLMQAAGYINGTQELKEPSVEYKANNIDYIYEAKTLADALLRISELKYQLGFDMETFGKLVERAYIKYGLPKVKESEPAAHGPKMPGTGVFDDNGHK
jgi:transcriptional regulator with XRE-family HTH domain